MADVLTKPATAENLKYLMGKGWLPTLIQRSGASKPTVIGAVNQLNWEHPVMAEALKLAKEQVQKITGLQAEYQEILKSTEALVK